MGACFASPAKALFRYVYFSRKRWLDTLRIWWIYGRVPHMLQPSDVRGLMAMMPAFATDEANQLLSVNTIAVDRLSSGLDQMIRDGADVIATTGSFGEFHTLLPEEFETLASAAVETARRRLPIFIGTTALNSREVVAKMRVVDGLGADGVIVGVPFYFPSSPANVVHFYKSIAELFPRLAIMAYHNPELHNVRFNVPLIEELLKIKGLIAMKDNARMPQEFVRLASVTKGRMSLFVNQGQYRAYAPMHVHRGRLRAGDRAGLACDRPRAPHRLAAVANRPALPQRLLCSNQPKPVATHRVG